MERPMKKLNDLSGSAILLDPDGTLIAAIELSLSSWLVAGIVPGVERQPLKKPAVDQGALLMFAASLERGSCEGRASDHTHRRRFRGRPRRLLAGALAQCTRH
jgi:hypothetical protein